MHLYFIVCGVGRRGDAESDIDEVYEGGPEFTGPGLQG